MAFFNYLLCVALLSGVSCNPLGQAGSVYDYSSRLPNQVTTVCESSNNVLPLGLGIGYPCPLNSAILPLPYPRNIWSNPNWANPSNIQTVCETTNTPNVLSILPLPNLPISGVSSTVCESTPSVVGFLPFPNMPNGSSVSETSSTIVPAPVLPVNPCISPLPYPGLIPGYSPYKGVPFL